MVTMIVPSPLRNVTGLPNSITEIQIRNALLTVLATLQNTSQNIYNQQATFTWLENCQKRHKLKQSINTINNAYIPESGNKALFIEN